jgi:phosphonate transport system permease protein
MTYAVLPQVRVAWTGISIYTRDVAFRAATVVGFFGAGGMGWYLKRNVQQLDTERVAAILLSIVVLVVIAEFISSWARDRVMKSGTGRPETVEEMDAASDSVPPELRTAAVDAEVAKLVTIQPGQPLA